VRPSLAAGLLSPALGVVISSAPSIGFYAGTPVRRAANASICCCCVRSQGVFCLRGHATTLSVSRQPVWRPVATPGTLFAFPHLSRRALSKARDGVWPYEGRRESARDRHGMGALAFHLSPALLRFHC